jgi:hypothetical protein
MTYLTGEIVRIDFPSHPWHGKAVEVVRDDPEVELGSVESMIARVIFCRGPGVKEAIGFGPHHIAGTAEAQQRRRWDADETDDRQGEPGGLSRRTNPYTKETDLCAAFIAALPKGWVAFNETMGWDSLLVRVADGCQVGIQAKLRLNAGVLCQAAETRGRWAVDLPGPDYRAVLVPSGQTGDLLALAPYCALTIIMMREPLRYGYQEPFSPPLPDEQHPHRCEGWYEMMPARRCPLPEYVPDVAAGASAPLQLTDWKIKALKLMVLLDATGYLTRADFKRLGIDLRRWIGENSWLVPCDVGFRANGSLIEHFRKQHPVVWEQIKAEPKKWQRPPSLFPEPVP